jgi:hypothetical protein
LHKGEPPVKVGGFTTPVLHQRTLRRSLGVVGVLIFRRVCFEGVFHCSSGCISHARYDVGVSVEGDRYVGVS